MTSEYDAVREEYRALRKLASDVRDAACGLAGLYDNPSLGDTLRAFADAERRPRERLDAAVSALQAALAQRGMEGGT